MAKLLLGGVVADRLSEQLAERVGRLRARGITPTLAVVRMGERADDLSYERGAVKRCEKTGVAVRRFLLDERAGQEKLFAVLNQINRTPEIHGCLLFRPLPSQIDDAEVRRALHPSKDVDGITDGSLAGVFTGSGLGFPPCTAQACMEILDYYGCERKGKRAVVIGRSLVIGRPAAMLLLEQNATVTICHTRTEELPSVCRGADILIAAAGKAGMVGEQFVSPGQVVLDVGIHVNESGKLCGDVEFDRVSQIVDAITPVPGGVGAVTTSVLVDHVVRAAERVCGETAE